ncbi:MULTISPECIES: hypothetical protein [Bacillus]|uniref:hypothetical protein n=1 Tax=Bacillus TaxID=1386 RepID=UPI0002E8A313|nr:MULTISPECIES: hypothetical protein [Bacillus]
MTDKLQVKYFRKGKLIEAQVFDGETERSFYFGGNYSLSHIHSQIPRLYMDERFERSA